LPWQQLSVQPSWQHALPHWPLQQSLQQAAFAAKAGIANTATAMAAANEIKAMVRFIESSLT